MLPNSRSSLMVLIHAPSLGGAPTKMAEGSECSRELAFRRQQLLQSRELVGFEIGLVPADPADPGKAHGKAGAVAGRALQPFEGDLQHQAALHLPHRAEAIDGV